MTINEVEWPLDMYEQLKVPFVLLVGIQRTSSEQQVCFYLQGGFLLFILTIGFIRGDAIDKTYSLYLIYFNYNRYNHSPDTSKLLKRQKS